MSPTTMRRATILAFVGPEIITLYLVAVLAGVGYSGGPKPISGIGLGEVPDFALAGPVGTVGAAYLQVDRLLPVTFAAAVPVGLLAASMLLINNIRDTATDGPAGKITLAVKLGQEKSTRLFVAFLVAAVLAVPLVALAAGSPWPLIAVGAAPLAVAPIRAIRSGPENRGLIRSLEAVSRLSIAFAGLRTLGLVLA